MKTKNITKYCAGLNGRPGNLEAILQEFGNNIYEVYAACPKHIAPTGRRILYGMDLKQLKAQVNLAHEHGVRFNVLMNGSCFGGGRNSAGRLNKKCQNFRRILMKL